MLGSDNHPSESTIALANSSRDLISADMGPLILRTASWPGRPDRAPYVENRPKDGFKAYKPVNEAGILTLPPISLPTPSGEPAISDVPQDSLPFKANNELSPPDDPPLLNRVLYGFVVYPNTLLYVSGIIIAVGTFLLVNSGYTVDPRFAQDDSPKTS